MNRVVLVGFPCAGKSTVAKLLARKIGLKCIDIDQEMESYYHTSISIFLQKFGEETFRKCENEMLKKLIREENIILSTGGGTPCFYDAMTLINEMAISVYLKLSPESLFVRLSQAKKRRPLVINSTPEELRNYITTTLAFREPIYQQAHITVKGESIDIKSLTDKLLDILCKK